MSEELNALSRLYQRLVNLSDMEQVHSDNDHLIVENALEELETTKRQLEETKAKFIEFGVLVCDIEECDRKSAKIIHTWIDENNEFLNKLKNERGE